MISIRIVGYAMGASVLAAACSHEVRPDDMTVEAHHAAARNETIQARQEMAKAAFDSPGRESSNVGMIPELYISPDATPDLAFDPGVQARSLMKRARAHERAAAELEGQEAEACKTIPETQRNTCPALGPVADVRDVDGGVRLRLADRERANDVLPLLRCAAAHAMAHGPSDRCGGAPSLRGVEFRETPDPQAIEVVGQSRVVSAEIRKLFHGNALSRAESSGS